MKTNWAASAAGASLCTLIGVLVWDAAQPRTAREIEAHIARLRWLQQDALAGARREWFECMELVREFPDTREVCAPDAANSAARAQKTVEHLQADIDALKGRHVKR